MNAIMERWVQTCHREVLDRTLIWNQRYLLHMLREFEIVYNEQCPTEVSRTPARAFRFPADHRVDQIGQMNIRRHQRFGGILNEDRYAA